MVRLNRIYTRTGDDGTTGLADGSRVSKGDARMAAIGDVDEANCAIGVARAALGPGSLSEMLARIQNDLFDLGADLATPGEVEGALRLMPGQTEWLEHSIDRMNLALEPLTSFVLPAGDPAAAALHLARAVVRRAERSAVAAGAGPLVLTYINRLSDLLFVAARMVNQNAHGDVLWVPGASRS
ncbi:cob(I)yrinic acid a,c-diamide adenosyltransferase [Sphingomonas canadensis]|uniref:Corrinoid adenosyltransferase n=1 Tax=Sphingomonas canadensis TaxID=1219257 RepID=A0ABW3H7U9_9SPHN|nr:cob(I)yrinic acid a,c-diamide adenosyltransferase [Sphingomonas canadensis]MCW3837181.1 cob(I)yrinic acid a,c-diamide adenosyltransferase [Sphingomonas canadensis]